jgi:hypothetical protein
MYEAFSESTNGDAMSTLDVHGERTFLLRDVAAPHMTNRTVQVHGTCTW